MRCEHCSNHQMQRTPSEPSANTPPPSLDKVPTYSTRVGAAPRAPGGARHGGGNRAVNSQPRTGQSTSYGDVKSSYGGAGGWDRRGCATWAPGSATRQGEEQHRHTERRSHTKRDKGEHSRQGGGAQQGRRGNQNSGNREPEWSEWWSVPMGGSDNKGDGLASQPRRYRVPGQPLLNRHQVGGVSRSPEGLFAQQEREPIRGRPAVRGKRTDGGRPGQCVEPPPTACLTATWAASEVPSLLMHPWGRGALAHSACRAPTCADVQRPIRHGHDPQEQRRRTRGSARGRVPQGPQGQSTEPPQRRRRDQT